MDSIFGLGETERVAFLRHMMQFFGSTYICLWSYSPLPSNCLKFLDGLYREESSLQQASSSSGSFATRLFDAYCGTLIYVDLGYVPGLAFKNNLPYMEMNLDYLQTISHSNEMQLQFYQRAGIKTLVFMGCTIGEIELGFSSIPQVNVGMEMRKWFPKDFSRQQLTYGSDFNQTLIPTSSSSLSLDSCIEIDYSSALLDIPTTLEAAIPHQIWNTTSQATTTTSSSPKAFIRYRPAAAGNFRAPTRKHRNLFGRAVLFYRDLNARRNMTSTQMQHAVQERRRREKLNESFHILKTLLPQLPKKDKASVLSSTTEYLTSLKSQVGELRKRSHTLETQLEYELGLASSSTEIERVSPSTSGERLLDLRVRLRSKECRLFDLVFGVLKMLQEQTNVSLLCVMQSNTRMLESTPLHALILRLKIEGDDFDECDFQEAVRRVVDGLPH